MPRINYHHSEETKRKIGLANKGKKSFLGKHHSKTTKEKLRKYHLGKSMPIETKERISQTLKGRPVPWLKGKKLSKEHIEKIRLHSAKTNLGKHLSQATKLKLSLLRLGKPNYKVRGKNNWNWKGGKVKPLLLIRSLPRYNRWRLDVYKRDGFKCVMCGDNKGGNLEADHIVKLSHIVDSLLKQYGGFTDEVREHHLIWDINNGRTLCIKCHMKTDTYGNNF